MTTGGWLIALVALLVVEIAVGAAVSRRARRMIERHDSAIEGSSILSGAEFARRMICSDARAAGVVIRSGDVDCYASQDGEILLADGRDVRASVTSLAVAGHEAAHALQDTSGWWAFKVCQFTTLVSFFAAALFVPLALVATAVDQTGLAVAAAIVAGYAVLTGLFTVWVEIDASRRAVRALRAEAGPDFDLAAARQVLWWCGATCVTEAVFDLGWFARRFADATSDDSPTSDATASDDAGPAPAHHGHDTRQGSAGAAHVGSGVAHTSAHRGGWLHDLLSWFT